MHKARKPARTASRRLSQEVAFAVGGALSGIKLAASDVVFAQGDAADAVFYIESGKIQVTAASPQGKNGVVALFGLGDFFGEGCLTSEPRRLASAVATAASGVVKIDKATMKRLLHERLDFSEKFTAFLVTRNIEVEADLVDQLFNSSEKRLARVLLILTNFNADGGPHSIPMVTQQVLAARVGTTRSRINYFLNKFRRQGLIEYNGTLKVHAALLDVIVHD